MTKNPYPNREYPVGALEYSNNCIEKESVDSFRGLSMLEYGEAELVYDLPRIAPKGDIVNLGHAMGGSALLMASCIRDKGFDSKIYSIDIFSGKRNTYIHELTRIKECGLEDIIDLRMGSTEFWGNKWNENGSAICCLFIDAGHSYPDVKNDFKLWSPFVNVGGLVAFHDTNQADVRRVLDEDLLCNTSWTELKNLHINRIRVFKKE